MVQGGVHTWGVDRRCRAEATKEAHTAILCCCCRLLLVRLLLRFQQAHYRRHLLQLCLIACTQNISLVK